MGGLRRMVLAHYVEFLHVPFVGKKAVYYFVNIVGLSDLSLAFLFVCF